MFRTILCHTIHWLQWMTHLLLLIFRLLLSFHPTLCRLRPASACDPILSDPLERHHRPYRRHNHQIRSSRHLLLHQMLSQWQEDPFLTHIECNTCSCISVGLTCMDLNTLSPAFRFPLRSVFRWMAMWEDESDCTILQTLISCSNTSLTQCSFLSQLQIIGFNSDLYQNMSDASTKANGLVGVALLIQVRNEVHIISRHTQTGTRFMSASWSVIKTARLMFSELFRRNWSASVQQTMWWYFFSQQLHRTAIFGGKHVLASYNLFLWF